MMRECADVWLFQPLSIPLQSWRDGQCRKLGWK